MKKGQVTKHMEDELIFMYSFMVAYQNDNNGFSPTFREMKDALNLTSLCLVRARINILIERGLVVKKGNQARAVGL